MDINSLLLIDGRIIRGVNKSINYIGCWRERARESSLETRVR